MSNRRRRGPFRFLSLGILWGLSCLPAHPAKAAPWSTYPLFGGVGIASPPRALAADGDGNLLVATERGVARFDGARWESDFVTTQELGAFAASLFVDSKDRLWVGTVGNPAVVLTPEGLTALPLTDPELPPAPNRKFTEDREGNIWSWSQSSFFVSRFDGTRWEKFDVAFALHNSKPHVVAVDSAGVVWFVGDKGIARLTESGPVREAFATAVTIYQGEIDRHGRLLVVLRSSAIDDYQIRVFDSQTGWVEVPNPATGGAFREVASGAHRELFLLNSTGIWKLDAAYSTLTEIQSPAGFQASRILGTDPYDGVWVEDDEGTISSRRVARFDGHDWQEYDSADGLELTVTQFLDPGDGSAWFGFAGGTLARFDGSNVRTYMGAAELRMDAVRELARDSGGRLWGLFSDYSIGSYTAVLDSAGWRPIRADKDPLREFYWNGSTSKALLPDASGGMWIVHDTGVTHESSRGWRTLTSPEYNSIALPGVTASAHVGVGPQGDLWVASATGAVSFDPQTESVREYSPRPGRVIPNPAVYPTISELLGITFDAAGLPELWTPEGIYSLRVNNWLLYPSPARLTTAPVVDQIGAKWTFASAETLLEWRGEAFHASLMQELGLGGSLRRMFTTRQGLLRILGEDAILRHDGMGWERLDLPSDLRPFSCSIAYEDSITGLFLFGERDTSSRVDWPIAVRYTGNGWQRFDLGRDLPDSQSYNPTQLVASDRGMPWITYQSDEKVYRFNGTSWSTTKPFENGRVSALWAGGQGEMFVVGDDESARLARFTPRRAEPHTAVVEGRSGVLGEGTINLIVGTGYEGSRDVTFSFQVDDDSPGPFEPQTRAQIALQDGAHVITVRARDGFGNTESAPLHVRLEVDSSPPVVVLNEPASGSRAQGRVEVLGSTSDSRFAETVVEVRPAAGTAWTEIDRSTTPVVNGLISSWETKSYEDGPYDLRVTVRDQLDLTASATVRLIIDNQDPPADLSTLLEVSAEQGGRVFRADGRTMLEFAPRVLPRTADVSVYTVGPGDVTIPDTSQTDLRLLTAPSRFSWEGLTLLRPARQEWRLAGLAGVAAGSRVAIHRLMAGGTWERVGGAWDPASSILVSAVADSGIYAVFAESSALPSGPSTVAELTVVPRILSFASSSSAHLGIYFRLDRSATVTSEVFNRAGRKIRTVASGQPMTAGANWLSWDGLDESGQQVEDGIYVLAIDAGSDRVTKMVAVSRSSP